jgi:type IV pilus assembly protein PilA
MIPKAGLLSMNTMIVLTFCLSAALAQGQAIQPQNARQALLEMFSGKPGTFEKHLPNATRKALRDAGGGGTSLIDQASLAVSMMNAQGAHLQTFEAGSTLLILENDRTQSKFEVTVENDALRGDQDEIQVSFRAYKQGQVEEMPVLPALTFVMTEEKGIWKLNELALTVRLPLADPAFLKTLVDSMKQRQALAAGIPEKAAGGSRNVSSANEASAIASMTTILTAEAAYAVKYPNHGYTCTLAELDGFGGDTPNEHQAMLIESRLASGKKSGYAFTLAGCAGAPATGFQLSAVSLTSGAPGRAFCADQSGVIRYSPDGQAASCFVSGKAIP